MQVLTDHNATIPQAIDESPGLHFNNMMLEGIEEIEHLARNQWTNYNASDPGIVMLESLCFGLLNLGYKTTFPLSDMLTNEEGEIEARGHFFRPPQIMFTNPVTENDFRRLLLDKVSALKNVWIKPVDKEPGVYKVTYELLHEESAGSNQSGDIKSEFLQPVYNALEKANAVLKAWENNKVDEPLRGYRTALVTLYKLFISKKSGLPDVLRSFLNDWQKEIENRWPCLSNKENKVECLNGQIDFLERLQIAVKQHTTISQAMDAYLMRHRNLGEVFRKSCSLCKTEVYLKKLLNAIYLEDEAVLETALASIIYQINDYFSPFLQRHTYSGLLEEGYSVGEILNGPPMANGYITDDSLARQNGSWNLVKIRKCLMKLKEVRSVSTTAVHKPDTSNIRYIDLENPALFKGVTIYLGNKVISRSGDGGVGIFKRFPELKGRIINAYNDLVAQNSLPGGLPEDALFPVMPRGEYRAIEEYQSIQYLFPDFYGLNNTGDLSTVTGPDAGPIKQLKAYMMFFEQLLANHQSQLAGLQELFGFGKDENTFETYLSQGLYNSPGARSLLKAFDEFVVENSITEENPSLNWKRFKAHDSNRYITNLSGIQATQHEQIERSNDFLSHQLAVVGENYETDSLISLNPNYGDFRLARVNAINALLRHMPLMSENLSRSYFYFKNPVKILLAGLEIKLGLLFQINGYYQGLLDLIKRYLSSKTRPDSIQWECKSDCCDFSYNNQTLLRFPAMPEAKRDKRLKAFAKVLECLRLQTEGFVFIDEFLLYDPNRPVTSQCPMLPKDHHRAILFFPREVQQVTNGSFTEMLFERLNAEGPVTVECSIIQSDYTRINKLLKLRRLWLEKILKMQRITPHVKMDNKTKTAIEYCQQSMDAQDGLDDKAIEELIKDFIGEEQKNEINNPYGVH